MSTTTSDLLRLTHSQKSALRSMELAVRGNPALIGIGPAKRSEILDTIEKISKDLDGLISKADTLTEEGFLIQMEIIQMRIKSCDKHMLSLVTKH